MYIVAEFWRQRKLFIFKNVDVIGKLFIFKTSTLWKFGTRIGNRLGTQLVKWAQQAVYQKETVLNYTELFSSSYSHKSSLPVECHVKHYLANQRFELTEFSRWLPHLSWTAVTNYFPLAGFKIWNIVNNPLQMSCFVPKLELQRMNYFYAFYRCVNSGESLINFT